MQLRYSGCLSSVLEHRAEGADAAGAWAECQQQLLLLACQPHPAQAHLLAEVWAGVVGCVAPQKPHAA